MISTHRVSAMLAPGLVQDFPGSVQFGDVSLLARYDLIILPHVSEMVACFETTWPSVMGK